MSTAVDSPAELAQRAATLMEKARARLMLDHPFLGSLVLRLPLRPAGAWCRRSATDARHIYYNPAWIGTLKLPQVQFMLAHEALHGALRHFARRGHRERQRWDLACDFAINPLLVEEGFVPPPEALIPDLYPGLCAEEIYPCLDDSPDQETLDQHLGDPDEGEGSSPPPPGAAPRPEPLGEREREQLAQLWQQHLASALQRAREAGQQGGLLVRLLGRELVPQVSWRSVLAGYLNQLGREDSSWSRPSRRESELMLPVRQQHVADVVVALDVSGSIGAEELAAFLAEIDAMKGCLPIRLSLMACDTALVPGCPWSFEPWEALRLPESCRGGGGTRFTPVFERLEQPVAHGQVPDVLIYFTDALGEFPPRAPDYPVLWLVKGAAPVPWGQRLQLN
jgi:predicted metal-dependent peptidase